MITLTPQGKEHVQTYIKELKAKQKEILDAKKDTAYDTNLPNENDILSDMSWVVEESDDGNYLNNWGVTDNYDGDYPLFLESGKDFIVKETERKKV